MKNLYDDDCIFCKICKGEIPSNTIYEDDYFKAILDISPAAQGHTILISKTHAANLLELPDEYAEQALKAARKCAKALKEVLSCDGVNILQNNGEAAGQTVFHFHIHVIPRFQDDKIPLNWKPTQAEGDDLASLAETLRGAIG